MAEHEVLFAQATARLEEVCAGDQAGEDGGSQFRALCEQAVRVAEECVEKAKVRAQLQQISELGSMDISAASTGGRVPPDFPPHLGLEYRGDIVRAQALAAMATGVSNVLRQQLAETRAAGQPHCQWLETAAKLGLLLQFESLLSTGWWEVGGGCHRAAHWSACKIR